MNSTASSTQSALPSYSALAEQNALLREQVQVMQRQLDWFKKQLFGPKSEKQVYDLPLQDSLFSSTETTAQTPPQDPPRLVKAYQRGSAKKQRDEDCLSDTGLRFTDDVPVEVIEQLPPELSGANADQYEIIGTKTVYRLAQRSSSYVVLKLQRPVFRLKGTEQKPVTTPAPFNVLDNSVADVSLQAGLLVDKFQFHLPLYRQHQRIAQAGVTLARSTLTNLVKRSIDLLRPIVDAQTDNVLRSRVLAMDETPIKAGHQGRAGPQKGTMKTGWFWPLYGDADEVVFTYSNSRGRAHIEQVLKGHFTGILISDGYAAYARYAEQHSAITHAQCWVHSRRYFIEAQKDHPQLAAEALQQIALLYQYEETIRTEQLSGDKKRQYRLTHAKAIVSGFFQWCTDQVAQADLLPSDPMSKALNYVLSRQISLSVFLEDADVPLDTNHLERALRPIPLGRKNWLFCWTELGAEHVGIIQSLITTCKLHDVNPYTYLVDVLQRISEHPASQVSDLTPRLWKERYAGKPLRSLVDRRHPDRINDPLKVVRHAH
jgi:transposase